MLPGEGAAPAFFPELVHPEYGWIPPRRVPIEFVKGFDPDATPYIGRVWGGWKKGGGPRLRR